MTFLRKLFDLFLKLVTLILAIGLTISLIAAIVLFNVERTMLQPDNLKSYLVENHLYDQLAPNMTIEVIPQIVPLINLEESQLPINEALDYLSKDDWQFIIDKVLPSSWLQAQTERAIDNTFSWLNGDKRSLVITVDMSTVQQRLDQPTRVEIAERLVSSWPECTGEEIQAFANSSNSQGIDNLSVCQPTGEYLFLRDPIVEMIATELNESLKSTQRDHERGMAEFELISTRINHFKQIQRGAKWSPLLPLALIILIGFTARTWPARFRWWSVPLTFGGLLALCLGLLVPISLEIILMPLGLSLPAAATASLFDILGLIISPITKAISMQAGVVIGVGLVFFAAPYIIEERLKKQKKTTAKRAEPTPVQVEARPQIHARKSVQKRLKRIARNLKTRRTIRLLLRSLWVSISVYVAGFVLTSFYFPELQGWNPYGFALVLFVGSIWAFIRWIPSHRLARNLDTRFKLFDQTATALEIEGADRELSYLEEVTLSQASVRLDRVGDEIKRWPRVPWLEVQALIAFLAIIGGVLYGATAWAANLTSAPKPLPPAGNEFLINAAGNPRLAHPYTWATEEDPTESIQDQLPPNAAQKAMEILAEALGDDAVAADIAQALEHGDPHAAAEALRRLADQSDTLSDATLDDMAETMRQAAQQMQEFAPDLAKQLERTASVLDGTGTAAQALHEGAEKLSEISPLYSSVIEQMAEHVAANDYEAAAETLQQAADALSAVDPDLAQGLESHVDAVAQQDIQAIADALKASAELIQEQEPDLARELDKTGRALEGETPGLTARAMEDLAAEMASLDTSTGAPPGQESSTATPSKQGASAGPSSGEEAAQMPGSGQSGESSSGQSGEGTGGSGSGAGLGPDSKMEETESTAETIDPASLNTETIPVELDAGEGEGESDAETASGPPSVSFSSPSGFVPVSSQQEQVERTGQDLLTYPNELTDVVRTYFSPSR